MKKTGNWSLRKKLIYSLFTLILVFFLFELAFRTVFYFNFHQYHTTVRIQGSALQQADDTLIYKNLPLYLDYDLKYQNNILGMKSLPGDVIIPEKKSNDFWIMLLGGSAMEGMGSNKVGEWLDITGVEDYSAKESIAGKLQEILQGKLPEKKVRVFNAANSGYVLWQSMKRYETLRNKIDADWVISMDGNNDTCYIDNNFEIVSSLKTDWSNYPIFHFPAKYIIPVTRNSAFVNYLKQKIYHIKNDLRQEKNKKNNYPARRKWLEEKIKPIEYAPTDSGIDRAVAQYLRTLRSFDSTLTHDSKRHLLILQPFLFGRNPSYSDSTEMAVYSYYTNQFNQSRNHTFRRILADSIHSLNVVNKNFVALDADFRKDAPVFVDYCHFTNKASDSIAQMLSDHIVQQSFGK